MSVSGSLRKVTLAGVTYRAFGDVNISKTGSRFEVEYVPTSGNAVKKMSKRVENIENIVLDLDDVQRDVVKALSESTGEFEMSITLANGAVYTATGSVNYDTFESEENRSAITMMSQNGWTLFAA